MGSTAGGRNRKDGAGKSYILSRSRSRVRSLRETSAGSLSNGPCRYRSPERVRWDFSTYRILALRSPCCDRSRVTHPFKFTPQTCFPFGLKANLNYVSTLYTTSRIQLSVAWAPTRIEQTGSREELPISCPNSVMLRSSLTGWNLKPTWNPIIKSRFILPGLCHLM